ncbi:hypothetical protein [Methylobacterium gregans]|uniref:Uncharacterized protein n=1 Tax=Methylobacterium gregans TaxID=374424 RepID=A0AA37HSU3_9HYPH|nr:hypothetical protein [Methylobacterium gregans]MDQ0523351.1 hypothetical protein [Methylobacterium gregans]GJD80949.1 hypothetical protein NBEOAGPD_4194 [Methylobacterium gregans]GLS56053.1 hypothetical protein GCM10007886_42380 [Methylobacterium gregans]
MSEEPDYPSRETITLATACSYVVVRAAFLYASHTSALASLGKLALLLLIELPIVTLLVAFVVNGFVLHIVGGQLRRLRPGRILAGLFARNRTGRAEDLEHYPSRRRGKPSGQKSDQEG